MSDAAGGARHRLTSRVLVLDGDRVLLLLTQGSVPAQPTRWITPGGGVDPGESHHDAARRELFEETGLIVDDLGEPVRSLDFAVDYVGGDHDTGHAEYYLLRTARFAPSDANWTDDERIDVLAHRWWTAAELRETGDRYEPADLPDLLDSLDPAAGRRHSMTDTVQQLIARVEEQERRLVLPHFDNDDAWELGSLLVRMARERTLPVTVDVTRGKQQLFHAALPGTAAHNDVWITRKVRTVREFGVSSYLAGLRARAGGRLFEEAPWIDPLRFAGHGGAFPIAVAGTGLVGTVAVSGLPQADDHALAVEALDELLARLPG